MLGVAFFIAVLTIIMLNAGILLRYISNDLSNEVARPP
jgi:hypothetical protein